MSDLHAAIRQRVTQRLALTTDEMPSGRVAQVNNWIEYGYSALEAVLDVHDPRYRMQAVDTGEWLMVDDCRDAPFGVAGLLVCTFAVDDRTEERYVPCSTTLAIAEKLGIET